jgi:release factor glutamine methyltransferase
VNLRDALALTSSRLNGETVRLDAQVLLANLLQRSRTWILAHPEAELKDNQTVTLERALTRLEAGEPLPYVIGKWEFFGSEFELTPHVLIPRPETEQLVAQAIDWLATHPNQRSVLEIGTGSGCIAIAIAKHIRDASILATDVSFEALALARTNARNHRVENQIQFLQADLFSAFPVPPSASNQFNLICSNPPYIPAGRLPSLSVSKWEPRIALDGGREGLDTIITILQSAKDWMSSPGLTLLEIDSSHSRKVNAIASQLFHEELVSIVKDLTGCDRFLSVAG